MEPLAARPAAAADRIAFAPPPSRAHNARHRMQTPRELRLLRLAVAHGLVTWDDLETVARRLSGSESDDGGIDPAAWLDALVSDGFLDRGALDRMAADLDRPEDPADTPGWSGGGGIAGALDVRIPDRREAADARIARDLDVLEDWDRYEVVTFIGAGGMGTVYKVFDPSLMRFAALKILQKSEPGLGRRLLREARAQARIDHPNVCQVYEAGEVEGRAYIAMQYIDGARFDEAIEGLPRDEVVRLAAAVARAVDAAHANGLVHRDLKPGNILVSHRASGRLHPYVVDFGLAKDLGDPSLSRTDVITGTPAYLSPEQIRGRAIDRRTDVFSLGVVLYEALTGRAPFSGATVPETLVRITGEDPVPPRKVDPTLPADLETIVLRCLEKDTDRRYGSARELAADLERYLAGEPILARAPSLPYRLGKTLRRNRALATVAAAAVVAVLLTGGAALRGQWLAHERAALAQRFGQEVTEVEATLRYALVLPLHDTSEHKEALRARMARIEREMERLGELAEGPGRYALGQAHLALHQYDEARGHLEAAWRSGYREPEVATALGLSLGHLYARSLSEAGAAAGSTERESFLREVRRAYREPAVSYLREARGGAAAAEESAAAVYVEGLLALYEGRYDAALAAARRAAAADPGLDEARRLEASIHGIRGDEALQAGSYDEALGFYERAGEVYAELVETYRSDAGLYAADCGRRMQALEVHAQVGRLPEPEVAAALAACDRALVADPGLAEAHTKRSRILWRAAEDLARRGLDPSRELAGAVAAASAAIAVDPRDLNAHTNLSVAYRRLAGWRMRSPGGTGGEDAAELLEKAIAAARAAVELAPERASGHHGLGNVHLQRADLLLRRGETPWDDLERAVAAYELAVEIDPRMTSGLTNLGNAWKLRAELEAERGLDPSSSIERSIAVLRQALAINPSAASAHNNLGNAHLTLGVWRLEQGGRPGDPGEPLDRATASYRRALAINPETPYGHYNLAFAERCLAEHRLRTGADPGPALARARAALAEATRLDPSDPDNRAEAERIAALEGRWRGSGGARGG